VGPLPGHYALSAMSVRGSKKEYDYFEKFFKPIATADYSIYIYHITLEDANRARRKLGLPELPEDWEQEPEPVQP